MVKGRKGRKRGSQEGSNIKEAEGRFVDMGEPNLASHPVGAVLSKAQGG